MYAEIVVNLPIEGTFHYHIPSELAGRVQPGHLVEVSFGQQKAQGVVITLSLRAPVKSTKPINSLIDRHPVITEQQMAVARWMSDYYLAPLSQCIQLFIPPGLSKRGDVLITPVIDPSIIEAENETQRRLLKLLSERGPLRGRQIERALPRRNWQGAVAQIVERGLILREPVLDTPSVSTKQIRKAEIAFSPRLIDTVIASRFKIDEISSARRGAAERRAQILRTLAASVGPTELSKLYAEVPGSGLADLRALADDELVVLRQQETWRDPLAGFSFTPDVPPQLTSDQLAAWTVVQDALHADVPQPPILIHGVTGSGKTEIYLRAVEHTLEQGRSAIVLVPEIALTPQTIRRFGARFQGRMGLIHSMLSSGERYDTWRRARSGQYDVIIGPRSALFTPMKNLGLIVIDECHDDSYKQSPPVQPPYYHAIPTAIELAKCMNALVVMGSATPNIAMYADASIPGTHQGKYILVEMPNRIMGHRRSIERQAVHFHLDQTRYVHRENEPEEAVMIDLPPVQIVDMRQELRAGNRSIFSRILAESLEETLKRGEQAILFLNRRGTATYVLCRSCGHVLKCPKCDTPLTWHILNLDRGLLVCHHCNYRGSERNKCPNCGSDQIRYFGGGTERVEEEVLKHFPTASVIRWDRDTTAGKDSHEVLLQRFLGRQANILIGTQMVAKSLDLPLVTLVGVISADTALHLPDYRSSERTFQLLTQVAGRAGRGLLGGHVILQTYAPEHYAIRAAASHNFREFYEQEIKYRQELGYPPFTNLVRLLVRAESSKEAQTRATEICNDIAKRIVDLKMVQTEIIGPAPAFYPRRDNLFRWHIIVRGPNPTAALEGLSTSSSLHIDIDPVSLL